MLASFLGGGKAPGLTALAFGGFGDAVWWLFLAVAAPPPICDGRPPPARYDATLDEAPTSRALAEVKAAYRALCPRGDCGRGLLFRNPSVGDNALTWIIDGAGAGARTRAKIVYGPGFLNRLEAKFGPGASFGVLAHEVGHHLTAAWRLRRRFEAAWNEELRADYLAGCALGRLRRPPGELENAMAAIARVATPSHPAADRRNPVIRRGYRECKKDRVARNRPFGLATLRPPRDRGCYRYRYRLRSDLAAMGPVAAPQRESKGFSSARACRQHRRRRGRSRVAAACRCVRGPRGEHAADRR